MKGVDKCYFNTYLIDKMEDLLFLSPVYKQTIWGGERLKRYDFDIPNNKTGEVWCISAHPNGDCTILNGAYAGSKLSKLYQNHRELFGNIKDEKFPILIKFIDATLDLSVQVHPGNEYALKHENSLGKCECWYVLDKTEYTRLVMGHNAKSKEEIFEYVKKNNYLDLLKFIDIKKEEMYWIPDGTLHAILEGAMIYEIQQSSDITYRVYDYEREDEFGNRRELHVEKGLDVINFPDTCEKTSPRIEKQQGAIISYLLEKHLFNVKKYEIEGCLMMNNNEPMRLITVLNGQGNYNGYDVKMGDSFIVTSNVKKIEITGSCTFMETTI